MSGTDPDSLDAIFPILDPRVPDEIRTFGLQFRNPAAFVEVLSETEYVLFASDGELIDLVVLSEPD